MTPAQQVLMTGTPSSAWEETGALAFQLLLPFKLSPSVLACVACRMKKPLFAGISAAQLVGRSICSSVLSVRVH